MHNRPPHRAAQKMRHWRKAQNPPMNAADFGRLINISPATVYRIETGERLPRAAVMLRLQARGICTVNDFTREPEPEAPELVGHG